VDFVDLVCHFEFHGLTVDLHEYLEGPHYSPAGPHPITNEDLPRTFGHEFAGTVVDVGSNVKDIKPGDKVSVYPLLYDGTCSRCKAGYPNICENLGFYGISGWGGGLSESVSVNRDHVYKLPPNMTTELGGISSLFHSLICSSMRTSRSCLACCKTGRV
jgi:threonine dehydrogenase-like Zn-dependent dehydrogenase